MPPTAWLANARSRSSCWLADDDTPRGDGWPPRKSCTLAETATPPRGDASATLAGLGDAARKSSRLPDASASVCSVQAASGKRRASGSGRVKAGHVKADKSIKGSS